MKLIFRLTNRGIEIVNSASEPLEPSSDADQKKPRGYYVYAHWTNILYRKRKRQEGLG